MHFDDRLATVLRQPVSGKAIARIQYQQLLDLLGTLPNDARGPVVDAGYERLAQLGSQLPASDRTRVLGESGLRLRNPRIVALLAQSDPPVATAAISAAQMSEDEWLDLIPALPVRARGILRHRRDMGPRVEARLEQLGVADRGLPANDEVAAAASGTQREKTEIPASGNDETEAIGAIVKRIEAFRKTKEPAAAIPASGLAPRLPFGDAQDEAREPRTEAFDFKTDAQGRIDWAEAEVAPMAVGMRLGLRNSNGAVTGSARLASAMQHRQPITGEILNIVGAPALSGQWQIDAVPNFDLQTGQFSGYSGRARRPADAQDDAALHLLDEADRMRQVLHELRTPVGAIQMSAEVIQQQLYGPTPHEYRALAATIASDTARILAGFEEMERLVKLDSGTLAIEPGHSDLAESVSRTVKQLKAHTDPRKSGFGIEIPHGPLPVEIEQVELDRLIWRLLAALAGAAAPSEVLSICCTADETMARVDIALPSSLASLDEEALFHAKADDRPRALSAGMFGLGFTLRLASAEAKAAGGSLDRHAGNLQLCLPGLTLPSVNLSQD